MPINMTAAAAVIISISACLLGCMPADAQQPAGPSKPYQYQRDEAPSKNYVRPSDEERFGLEVAALSARVARLEEEIEMLKKTLEKRAR